MCMVEIQQLAFALQEKTAEKVFNKEAFLRKRSRITGLPPDPVVNYALLIKELVYAL